MIIQGISSRMLCLATAVCLSLSASTSYASSTSDSGGAPAPMPAQFTTSSDGTNIAFYRAGHALSVPLLVLSGGPGSDHRYMRIRGALDELAGRRDVIFFDQRGTSLSGLGEEDSTIDLYVADVEAIRTSAGADRVDLLGHSFGGYLAIAYAAQHPERVRSITLVASAPPKLGEERQLLGEIFPDRIEAWREKRSTLKGSVPAPEFRIFQSMEFVDQKALHEFLTGVSGYVYSMETNNALRADMRKRDYWPALRSLNIPILIMHGRYDAVLAPVNSWAMHQASPCSEFYVFEDAGHIPHVERPEEFAAKMYGFLDGVDRGDAKCI